MQYGDSYYQKYSDYGFKLKYQEKWNQLCLTSTEVLEENFNSSTSDDTENIVTKPMIGATICNCGMDSENTAPADALNCDDVDLEAGHDASKDTTVNLSVPRLLITEALTQLRRERATENPTYK
jgi:hypothetical protein